MLQGSELMSPGINPIHFFHFTFISQLSTFRFYKAFTFPPTLYHSVLLWSSSLRPPTRPLSCQPWHLRPFLTFTLRSPSSLRRLDGQYLGTNHSPTVTGHSNTVRKSSDSNWPTVIANYDLFIGDRDLLLLCYTVTRNYCKVKYHTVIH